jgi:hypothetical protein
VGVQRLLGVSFFSSICMKQDLIKRELVRDNANGRVFQTELPDNQALTVQSCITSCSAQDFTLAGLEFGVQCCTFDRRRRSIDRPFAFQVKD